MRYQTLFDDRGQAIRLGAELGRGGEASVYELPARPNFVAKVYHKSPGSDKSEKLTRMVALQTDRILKLAAWPVAVLRTKQGSQIVGVALPNVGTYKDVHLLYSPKSRIKEFPPKVNWPFLIRSASNIARAFAVIHEYGHVIGDVNQSNVRVSPDSAVVSLIDCDSFQIHSEARYFLCEVGVPLYTPPELQEKTFSGFVRTSNHDNFGLAVLIFHLLFMGRHPYAGKFSGRGEMPIEKAIYEFRFAYSRESYRTQMQPPPNSLTLSQISPALAGFFEQAFSPNGVKRGRPTATEWVNALASFEGELKKCTINPGHHFYKAASTCPWCEIEGRTGIVLFVGVVSYQSATGFNLEIVWARIQSVPAPEAAVQPDFRQMQAEIKPTSAARIAGLKRRTRQGLSVGLVLVAVLVAMAVGLGAATFWIAVVAIGIANAIWRKAGDEKRPYEAELRTAESRLLAIRDRWNNEASDNRFRQRMAELNQIRAKYCDLPKLRQARVQELQKNLYHTQLHPFLEQFSISTADISHIGDTRKAMLASFNIDTAADITTAAVDSVPGFGQFLTSKLLDWRKDIESKFVFNSSRGIHPDDLRAVDKEISDKRAALEAALLAGAAELARTSAQIMSARQLLWREMENATRQEFEARANARAA